MIRSGRAIVASIVGLAAVVVFMVIYYRLSGVNAAVALLLELGSHHGGHGSTLAPRSRFPGLRASCCPLAWRSISNVLIFERIREELWSGKNVVSAVNTGSRQGVRHDYRHARSATMVSILFLFLFGTGPVKGFAVVLFWGLGRQSLYGGLRFKVHVRLALSRSPKRATLEHLVM